MLFTANALLYCFERYSSTVNFLTKTFTHYGCLLLVLCVLFSAVAIAGLPQGSQSLVRFRRAYLLSNVTFPAAVGYYPQQEDDQAASAAIAKNSVVKPQVVTPALKPVPPTTGVFKSPVVGTRTPVIRTAEGVLIPHETVSPPPDQTAFKQRVKHGILNFFNLVEIGDASIAKRLEVSPLNPSQQGLIRSVDNGEDYLYLPAIGIPVPVRLQIKTTFVH